jgi:hypothetical protein
MRKPKTISSYQHVVEDMGQVPDNEPGDYFVSAQDDGRFWLVSGPYVNDHAAALADVETCRSLCESHDSRAVWMAFGTCRLAVNSGTLGILQRHGLRAVPNEITAGALPVVERCPN